MLGGWPRRVAASGCLLLAVASAALGSSGKDKSPGGVPVLVAARALPAGTMLTGADLRATRWPRSAVPDSVLTDLRSVVGQPIGAAMAQGEALTRSRMLNTAISAALGRDQVAVAITLRDSGEASIVGPGALLDLYAGTDAPLLVDGRTIPAGTTDMAPVASSVRVLALASGTRQTSGEQPGLTVVIAADRKTAARLTALPSHSVIATLRPS